MNIKEQCELYLKYKYEYYIIGRSSISDYEFDVFEKDLKETKDKLALKVTSLVDFPSLEKIKELNLDIKNIAPDYEKVTRDEKDYPHPYPMLSTQKIQVNDEDNLPYHDLELFLNRAKTEYYIAEEKLDGNGIEITYKNGVLTQILSRGDSENGKDKTNKLSLLVPKKITNKGLIVVRGELVIEEEKWERKYKNNDTDKGQNSRNFVGGIVSKQTYIYEEIMDLDFIAFSYVEVKKNKEIYFENEQDLLISEGFNQKHRVYQKTFKSKDDFKKIYFDFKNYRETTSPYKIDGIVLKFPHTQRNELGSSKKYPYWNQAIKFIADVTTTKILSIEWNLSKTGELSPVAILEPVLMDGRWITRASLANLGNIIKRRLYPGSTTSIRLAGDIIAQCIDMVKPSPDEKEYIKEFENYINI